MCQCDKVHDNHEMNNVFVLFQVQFLARLSSHNVEVSVRHMMRFLGTNNLWSKYSLKGFKGKLPLKSLPVYSAIISKSIFSVIYLNIREEHLQK